MSTQNVQLHAVTPDGRIDLLQLAQLDEALTNDVSAIKPLVVKSQPGFHYKLIDTDAGRHLKGQKLLRSEKNLKVLLGDTVALELHDYFVASVSPLPNRAVYKLENQSCEEVEVTSHLPNEAFSVPESLVWTDQDDATDCKVALLNPGAAMVFAPTVPVAAGIGLLEVSGATLGLIALNGGNNDTQAPTLVNLALTSATGYLNSPTDSGVKILNASDTLTATITFSEAVTLNTSAGSPTLALLIGSATVLATYVSGSGTNSLTFTTTIASGQNDADGVAIASNALSLNGATLKDAAGNNATVFAIAIAPNAQFLVDTTSPTLTISSILSNLKIGETAAINFTFSEDPGSSFSWNGTTGDVDVLGGTLGALSGTGLTRTAIFKPTANLASDTASITVAANTYLDAAGNYGGAGTTPLISIDTLAPSVTVVSNLAALNAGLTANITFSFSEDPGSSFAWDGTTGDLVVTGGTLGAASSTGLTRTAVFTPMSNVDNGTASITVSNLSYNDTAGNTGSAGTTPNIRFDTLAPSVSIESNVSTLKAGDTANITFTFSEDPGSSFAWDGTTGDLVVTGGTLGAASGTGLTRTAVFTPTSNVDKGKAGITVSNLSYTDTAGNAGSEGITPNIHFDTLQPTVNIASNVAALNAGDTAIITFSFSEDPGTSFTWNGTAGDVLVTGGSLGAMSGTGLTRTAVFVPAPNQANGSASITVPANSYQDAAGNLGNSASLTTLSLDTQAPSVASLALTSATGYLTSPADPSVKLLNASDTPSDTLSASFFFSEVVILNTSAGSPTLALLIGSATVLATYVSGSGSNALIFSTTIASGQNDSDGVAIASNALSLNGATLKDNSGNNATISSIAVSNNSQYLVDTTAPTLTISSDLAALKIGDTAIITFSFSEDPGTSFTWNGTTGDVLVTGGSLGAMSGTGLTRTAVFVPAPNQANGSASITVPANSYQDAAGNLGNSASLTTLSLDTQAPSVASLALTSATGYLTSPTDPSVKLLNAPDTLTATITFNEAVTLNTAAGSPTLALLIGSATVLATYVSGSGSNALIFSTTIASGQTDTDGVAITNNALRLNGATLKDESGNNATISSIAVSNNPQYLVDTTAPIAVLKADTLTEDQTSTRSAIVKSNELGKAYLVPITKSINSLNDLESLSNSISKNIQINSIQTETTISLAGLPVSIYNLFTVDLAGNISSISTSSLEIAETPPPPPPPPPPPSDDTPPSVLITTNVNLLKAGETAIITFTFSEEPGGSFTWNGSAGDVLVSGGSLSAIVGNALTRTAVFTPTANLASGSASITVTNLSYTDIAGNAGSAGVTPSISIDTLAPVISSLALSSSTGGIVSTTDATVNNLNASDTLLATVTYDDVVTVNSDGGSPSLDFVIGTSTLQALYVSGSGTNALVFRTTVASGQNDNTGVAISINALSLNNATIKDASGNNAIITSLAVADNVKYLVDTTAPTLAITSSTATLNTGETATITFTFSEDPGSSFIWASNAGDVNVSGGTLGNISGTGTMRTATFTPTQNVASGTANISVAQDAYTDAAGNFGVEALTPVVAFYTSTPVISSIALNSATGAMNNTLNTGDVIFAKVVFSEAITLNNSGGSPTLGLLIEGTLVQAAYVSGTDNTDFVFSYTILAGQNDSTGISVPVNAISLNGSTFKNAANNYSAITSDAVADNALYVVDTTAPNVAITSSKGSLKTDETSVISYTFTEDPGTSFTMSDVTVTGGTLSALTGLGTVRRSTFTPTSNLTSGTASITVAHLSYTDSAGNPGSAGVTPVISIDTLAPLISSVALSSSTGGIASVSDARVNNLNATDNLTATVMFNDAVTLNTDGGSPTLALQIGGNTLLATYVSGSGTTALLFTTTIAAGQTDANGVAIAINALNLNNATLKDVNGNNATITSVAVTDNAKYLVDTTAPTMGIASDVATLKAGETANIIFTFSEDPGIGFAWDGSAGDVLLTGGTLGAMNGTGLTRTAVFTPTANLGNGSASITVAAKAYQDAAGNNGEAGLSPSIAIDTLAPGITSLLLTSSTGGIASAGDATVNNLNATDTLTATVTFDDALTVNTASGSPTLALVIGGSTVQANYVSGSGTNTLVFTTTVAALQNDSNGVAMASNALSLNGATIKDANGNNASITSSAVSDNAKYLVDTTRPTVNVTSDIATLNSAQTATITFTFSEDPFSSFVWNGTTGDLVVSGGTLSALSTTGNPLTRTAILTPATGVSGGTANVVVNLNSYSDAAGNLGQEAVAGVTDKSVNITVNTTTTSLSSVVISSADNIQNNLLNAGDVVYVTATYTELVKLNVGAGTPSLKLNIGGIEVNALYASGSGTNALVFAYTVLSAQTDINGISIVASSVGSPTFNLNGRTLTDTAANTTVNTYSAVADNASYLVDTTAPTLVSIVSSRSTFLSGQTSTITFTFSEDPGATFAWNGTAGDLTLVEGTLTAISGTGLTRTATFYPTQGLTGVNASLTVSNNLFTDLAGNLGSGYSLTGLVINTSPATLMSMQLTSAVGLQNSTLNAGDTVNVTAHFSEAQTLDITGGSPTLALQIDSTAVVATYVSGAGTSDLVFSYAVLAGQTDTNGIAINTNALQLNGSTLIDPRGNTTHLPASVLSADNASYKVDTTASTLSITSDESHLKIGETANITFTFSEDPGGTFTWDGTTGDVNLTNGSLSAITGTGVTRSAVYTPSNNFDTRTATITVNNATYQDAAGNNGGAGASPSLSLDTLKPSIDSVAITSATDAQNSILNANDTANISVVFSETLNLNLAGGSPTVSLMIGTNTELATYVSGAGSNILVFTTTIASGQTDIDGIAISLNALTLNGAVLTDTAGNAALLTSSAVVSNASYKVDTTAPILRTMVFDKSSLKAGEIATVTLTFSEDVSSTFTWNGTAGDFRVTGGTLSAISSFVLSGSDYVATATFTPTEASTATGIVSTALAAYTDPAGNSGNVSTSASIAIDTLAPTLTTMNISGASGILSNTLNAGDVLEVTATFNEAVLVNAIGNKPQVQLNIGGTLVYAAYASGSGTTDLLFNYTILTGQNDGNGISYSANALGLNTGTLLDATGNAATLTTDLRLDNLSYKVDTTAPTVTITSDKVTLLSGQTTTITITFSEDPGTSFDASDITLTNGTLSALSGTGLMRTTTFTPASNISSTNTMILVGAGTYQDAAGNAGSEGRSNNLPTDTSAPTILSMAMSTFSTGLLSSTFNAGDVAKVEVVFSEVMTVNTSGGVPTLGMTIGATTVTASYLSGSDNHALLFSYTILAGQTDTDGISLNANSLNANGGTLTDVLGNAAVLTHAAVGNSLGYKVDTTSPTLLIASNKSTLLSGETATVTFTFSEDPDTSFAWNGTTGDIVLAGGTLGAISGSGLTRTATFTPTPDTASSAGSISVAAGTYTDIAGNMGGAGTSPSLTIVTFKNKIYLTDIAANIGGYAIDSPNTSAYFGHAVSMVGDFNGDGFGDVISGAQLNTQTASQGGGAVIVQGGLNSSLVTPGYSGFGQVSGMYLYANLANGWAGFSVAGVGDMNKDGYMDVLIGMPRNPSDVTTSGQAFLVYGKKNASGSLEEYQKEIVTLAGTSAALKITLPVAGAGGGFSVSSAGDVNGDGWTDLIVSSHFEDIGSLNKAGKSYVIYGSAALSALQTVSTANVGGSVAGFTISGWQAGEESGTSVSSAGDFNGDGKADLLVSAYFSDITRANSGTTYVVLGKTGNTAVDLNAVKNNTGGFAIIGENGTDYSGVSVSSAGDVNGDGLGDIVIGAIVASTSAPNRYSGKTYVVFGRSTANAAIDLATIASGVSTGGFAIISNVAGEQSGHSVSSAGDINGDGLMDIILGAPNNSVNGSANTGQSYVVYGKATTTNVNLSDIVNNTGGFAIVGEGGEDLSGYSVGAAGDVNGDGLADLIVGAPGYDAAHGTVQSGRSYVILGAKTNAFKAGSFVDDIGTSGNDALSSTGGQTLAGGSTFAGTGNDTFTSNGADVLLGGNGADIFILNQSTIIALQNVFGAGGNTTQLARIDGGGGIDTIRLGGAGALDLNLSLIKNIGVGNIEGMSRINSIEYIDMRTDLDSNKLTIRVDDVLDMSGSNWINALSDFAGEGGWKNKIGGTTMNQNIWKYHQIVVDGTNQDTVSTAGWTLQTTGALSGWKVGDTEARSYDVYIAADGRPAMMMVEQAIVPSTIL